MCIYNFICFIKFILFFSHVDRRRSVMNLRPLTRRPRPPRRPRAPWTRPRPPTTRLRNASRLRRPKFSPNVTSDSRLAATTCDNYPTPAKARRWRLRQHLEDEALVHRIHHVRGRGRRDGDIYIYKYNNKYIYIFRELIFDIHVYNMSFI